MNFQDHGENSRVTYRLVNNRASEFLSIDKHSGKVTLRNAVDFEKIQRFHMEVEACDNGTPKLCSTADLTVLVEVKMASGRIIPILWAAPTN